MEGRTAGCSKNLAARDRRDARGFEVRSSRFSELRTRNFESRLSRKSRASRASVGSLLGGGFEEAQLPFFGAGQGDGVALGEAGVAILARRAGGGVQHAIET